MTCVGTAGAPRGHFTAKLEVPSGRLRVDHTGDLGFWLEVELPADMMEAYVAWKYRPDGPAVQEALHNEEGGDGVYAGDQMRR